MTATFCFATRSWLNLCAEAERACILILPNPAAEGLPALAGKLTTIEPPLKPGPDRALCQALRWTCTAYGLALPERRRAMAEGLRNLAKLTRAVLDPPPEGADAAAAALSPPAEDEPLPVREPRRDVFG